MSTPSEAEIEVQREAAVDQTAKGGTRYGGMTYEEGVRDTIDWMLGESDYPPMEMDEE